MEGHIFLWVLAFVWTVFAVLQDLKTTEVSNWLNFSLIAFGMSYRAFYALVFEDLMFFLLGVIGVIFFVVLAYLFYYGKVFAGGDAKLLMGFGSILPYSGFGDVFVVGLKFILLFFVAGVLWTLGYSLVLVLKGNNKKKFGREFGKIFSKKKKMVYFAVFVGVVLFGVYLYGDLQEYAIFPLFIVLLPLLYFYVQAIEKAIMIRQIGYNGLREGDWLERDVKVGSKVIRKSVHGLSSQDIKLLKKYKKRVWIKQGVPFTPSFLIALVVYFIVF